MMTAPLLTSMPTLQQLLPQASLPAVLANYEVMGLASDSRDVHPGYVFVAVQGLHHHGRDFVEQAASAGAIAIIYDKGDEPPVSPIPVVAVDDLSKSLSTIAGRFYGQPSVAVPVMGVTGTNGKTTCTQLLGQLLARLHEPCGVMGTLGCGVLTDEWFVESEDPLRVLAETGMTTPDAIRTQHILARLLRDGAHAVAMEVSSHGLDQHRVAALDIDLGVFTNLTHDHLDYHGTMENYAAAKAKLFDMPSMTAAVINQDDPFGCQLIDQVASRLRLATYSMRENNSCANQAVHFSFSDVHMGAHGLSAKLLTPEGDYPVNTQLMGEFNLSNLLAVISALYLRGYSLKKLIPYVQRLTPIAGRMELIPNALDIKVVIDYAHTPDALANALSALKAYTSGNLWCVFGCGGDRDRAKRPLMAKEAEAYADHIIVTSDNPRTESAVQIFADIEQGFSQPREVIADRASAIEYVVNQASPGDVVLIAGKGHENYQIIGERQVSFSDRHQARFFLQRRETGGQW